MCKFTEPATSMAKQIDELYCSRLGGPEADMTGRFRTSYGAVVGVGRVAGTDWVTLDIDDGFVWGYKSLGELEQFISELRTHLSSQS